MVESLLIVKNTVYDNEDGISQKTNTPLLNSDDDESASMDGSQQASENLSKESKSDLASENQQPEKVKKRKLRPTEQKDDHELKKRISKKRPWYTKIDLVKPIMFLSTLLLIYLIWVNRDVLIVRLLTSNARVYHTALRNEQKLLEKMESPEGLGTKDSSNTGPPSSSTPVSPEDEIINSNNDKINDNDDDNINNDPGFLTDNDEDSPKVTNKYSSGQKVNLRTRRNKMSFSKDRTKKKGNRLPRQSTDGDDNINDDVGDDDDVLEDDIDKIVIGSNKVKEPISPSPAYSSKKHHHRHHRSTAPHEENTKTSLSLKHGDNLSSNQDIIAQLKKIIQPQIGHQDLTKVLAKATGLSHTKINRFIHRKDYTIITLATFMSLLNSFDSTILILSK